MTITLGGPPVWPDADEHGESRARNAARFCGRMAVTGAAAAAILTGVALLDGVAGGLCLWIPMLIASLWVWTAASHLLGSLDVSARSAIRAFGLIALPGLVLALPLAALVLLLPYGRGGHWTDAPVMLGLAALPLVSAATIFVRVLHWGRFEQAWKHGRRT